MYIADLSKVEVMKENTVLRFIENVLNNMPSDWLYLTTHRLDIYNEDLAKTEFLQQFDTLYAANNSDSAALRQLPTAYDYIRLGHPLSSILEWGTAISNDLQPKNVISFSSQSMPVLAILRTNALQGKRTRLVYKAYLPKGFSADVLQNVYGYTFEIVKVDSVEEIPEFDGSTILISNATTVGNLERVENVDFYIHLYEQLGSLLYITNNNTDYISDIQHVRRRETIAMTPANSLTTLQAFANTKNTIKTSQASLKDDKEVVLQLIKKITNSPTTALVASSGLSMQYAIMMGLVDNALEHHKGKKIKFIVPPNCYGGTNDQARRVADSLENVEVVDLPVDGENNMVDSIDRILADLAIDNAVPYIVAEIPTNPRVEVPDLEALKAVLSKTRITSAGAEAIAPVFILDQTFCPNYQFLGKNDVLSSVKTLSYVSGSKFPSGGKCTAGYCVGNDSTQPLMILIEKHLDVCDNEATPLQYEILSKQMPSMNQRIQEAYIHTREFVNYIHQVLPEAKINFVSEELATQGFTPSVFSMGLPTKGTTEAEKENYKRELNLKLIRRMITEIPDECKFCVSYGQLKGSYWTIPATSTQGTTKEGDKDYIVRVSVSPNLDLERHKRVFSEFVKTI